MLTECHNNVSVSSLPDEPGPPPNKMRRLKDIEPPEELLQLTTGEYVETFMIIVDFSHSVHVFKLLSFFSLSLFFSFSFTVSFAHFASVCYNIIDEYISYFYYNTF